MSTPKQVSTQTRSPRGGFVQDPGRHYVVVEKDKSDEYLDQAATSDPAEPRYQLDSSERKNTGLKGHVLLSCTMEEHVAMMAENTIAARGGEDAKTDPRAGDDPSGVTTTLNNPRTALSV